MTAPPRADINITPMIDVMLVVLIIFMIVTPVMNSPVVLPRSTYSDPRPENAGDIVLTIRRDGGYVLSTIGGPGATQQVAPATSTNALPHSTRHARAIAFSISR